MKRVKLALLPQKTVSPVLNIKRLNDCLLYCSTILKAKLTEAQRVFVLSDTRLAKSYTLISINRTEIDVLAMCHAAQERMKMVFNGCYCAILWNYSPTTFNRLTAGL